MSWYMKKQSLNQILGTLLFCWFNRSNQVPDGLKFNYYYYYYELSLWIIIIFLTFWLSWHLHISIFISRHVTVRTQMFYVLVQIKVQSGFILNQFANFNTVTHIISKFHVPGPHVFNTVFQTDRSHSSVDDSFCQFLCQSMT